MIPGEVFLNLTRSPWSALRERIRVRSPNPYALYLLLFRGGAAPSRLHFLYSRSATGDAPEIGEHRRAKEESKLTETSSRKTIHVRNTEIHLPCDLPTRSRVHRFYQMRIPYTSSLEHPRGR